MIKAYTVVIANNISAESPEDAAKQMVEWLEENASEAGYRVIPEDGSEAVFINASKLDTK